MKYVDFNDETIPIGKRKVAFVKWAISQGTDPDKAKRIANKKFGFEQRGELVILVVDYGRMHQNSFDISQVYAEYRYISRRYEVVSIGYDFVNSTTEAAREFARKNSTETKKYVVCTLLG